MATVEQIQKRLVTESDYYKHYAPVSSETTYIPVVVPTTETEEPVLKPVRKVSAAGIAGALSILVVFLLGQFNIEVTNEVASAITAILAFVTGYMVPASPADEQVTQN